MVFNTCGWTGDSASTDAASDAGMSTGGTLTRNETLTNPETSPETAPLTPSPVTASTEYVNTNTTMPDYDYEGQGMMCAAWAAMETIPSYEQSDLAASGDFNVRFTCEITARNKTKCTAKCLNGGKILGKNKFVMMCKCPRWVSSLRHYVIVLRNTLHVF